MAGPGARFFPIHALESDEGVRSNPDLAKMRTLVLTSVTGRSYHAGILQQKILRPKGAAIGIPKLGWHTFRHTYRSLLDEAGAPIGVQQKLMRHSNVAYHHERLWQLDAAGEAGRQQRGCQNPYQRRKGQRCSVMWGSVGLRFQSLLASL
jgi:integrase